MTTAIVAQDLSKTFADVHAVDHVTFEVAAGEIYGLVGPDGAGKTTMMRLLCGGFRSDTGHVTIYGHDVIKDADAARTQIGYLAQRFSLYGDLTVLENLRFFAEIHGIKTSEWQPRTQEILKFVGLDEFSHRRAEQLSGGMKQKLGLATALVHRPKVLLLDEPTGGVDPVTRQDFWQLIIRIVAQEGVSVVVSTPYMDEASRCTRIGFISRGKIISEGTPSQVTSHLNDRVLELIGDPLDTMRHTATIDADVEDVQVFGDRLHLRLRPDSGARVLDRLPNELKAKGVQVQRIRSIMPTLEDVFIELSEQEYTQQ
jgi:drug efflux transport system ATP-binding protein